ncbi:F0F1 ATP synthase subunit B family protein [Novosphingopyxis sp. YJ-S2-01]|uniref:F0F1 ATP synthase subunit B family protein n=1 Tax=Novosphingopyxis sp. YJ-S2-01 TaxID=2794021 RepID=UPI001E569F93|nr:F0F1 ATP synthase subunit B [Novosphingopyxis sp. YJ-S2-01]
MAQTNPASQFDVTGNDGAVVTDGGSATHSGSPIASEGMPQTGIEAIEAGHTVVHEEPSALGMTATAWVSVAMLVLIALVLWKKVPAALGRSLDGRIDAIRRQLAEASELRAEAEKLRAQYEKQLADAQKEAADIRELAEHQAAAIVEKAEEDSAALVRRRKRLAEEQIAVEERAAIAELRETAAKAAVEAARRLIADKHDASADREMIDRSIRQIGGSVH